MNASLVRSYLWQSLIKFKLKENMRAKTDPAFSRYILQVGNGLEEENEVGEIKLPSSLILEPNTQVPPLEQLIQFVFPSFDLHRLDPLSLTTSAILTPKNQAVDEINEVMIGKFPGKEHTYLSFDETSDPTQQGLYIDFLNSVTPQGMPSHRLNLKKNSPILLLRNINPSQGLCNGTRLICKEFRSHLIVAQIAVQMAPNIMALKDITLTSKNFTVQAIVVEKNIPRMSSSGTSLYQRIMLQDKEENRMQATVFGYNIKVFESSLKLYHTYSITNPTVRLTPEMFPFLENKNQLGINARTPVEEIEIDGLTMRTMKYNFTPITSLQQIKEANPRLDVLFVILNVGPRKFINNSYVVDVRITDQSLQPSVLSLWDHFLEYEAPAMANLPGSFPVVIGLRLKTSKYYGCTLATRNSSSFIFDVVLPEAITLQSWTIANTAKLRELAATEPEYLLMPKGPENPEDDAIKIANLPISVDKGQLALPMLHKLAEPKECSITLKASMHSYAGINQLRFTVHSISIDNNTETADRSEPLLALPPNTPNKRSKKGHSDSTASTSSPTTETTEETNPTESSLPTQETPASPNQNK
ncbi:hypothetical protein RHGRI_004567 [Rhododendron griersonianum]|uniref:DNA helicase Pif1-like 2B domain-containing protein n=1 Tax=Rhododendron griersonianum TaxID=479676 RepID=A0AAV6L9D3_9ERIC|nr:hypothetical protein RHGRI_004567 [Rhododendron griersonianum]